MDEVEEVKQRLDVAEVVGAYIPLKQAGRNMKAPCPFHNEKSASFMVSPEKAIWHCFGCGAGGDAISFVMRMEGMEFRPALEKLAQQVGVELKSRGDGRSTKLKARYLAAHQLAVRYFQACLVKNPKALEYVVKQRGLSRQTVKEFQIGYAPESWEGLVAILRKGGFDDNDMVDAGLAGRKNRGAFDLFRGRVMFTICDGQGQPVGFTGRVLPGADDNGPKYLNTPQTLLYDKSRAIFGLHLAREAIRASNEAVLVEGNMDVVASHQAGVRQVVAASGTALTLDQLKTLSRLTKNIVLAFDQDAAGLKATERVIELAGKLGLMLKVADMGEAKDPDELITESADAWRKAIHESKYVIDYLFDRFAREYDLASATGKRQYTDRLCVTINRLSDPVERDHYIQRLAAEVGVSAEAVKQKVEAAEATEVEARKPVPMATPPPAVAPKTARQRIEEQLLSIVAAYPDANVALEDLSAQDFSTPELQAAFALLGSKVENPAPGQIGGRKSKDAVSGQRSAANATKPLPESSDYVKILALRGEEQYDSYAPADRSFEAFELTRRLQTLASRQSKQAIGVKLRAAESSGDVSLAKSLLEQYQALINE